MIVIGGMYLLRKHLKLKPEYGDIGEKFTIKSKCLVTVVDVQHVGTGRRNNEFKVREFYKVAVVAENKIGWIRHIDEVKLRQTMRLVEDEI